MQDYIYQHRKAVFICGVAAVIIIIAISVFFIVMDRINSATVNILVAPSIAKVKVGGKVLGSYGSFKMQPGEYTVEVSADGFETKTSEIVAVADKTVNVRVYLMPTDESSNWYEEHEHDALILGEIKNEEALDALQKLKDDNPILSQLPMEVDYFTDNYSQRVWYTLSYVLNDDISGFVITITDYSGGNREAGMKRLKNLGADLDKYEVEYRDASMQYKGGHAF